MTGEPAGATNDSLVWKSPLFDDPLKLSWSVLHRGRQEIRPDAEPPDSFAFVLPRRASRIVYGDPTGLTARDR